MATKCFCDRCGEIVEDQFNDRALKIKRHFESGGQIWDEYQSYDLCPRCLKRLMTFLQMENEKND